MWDNIQFSPVDQQTSFFWKKLAEALKIEVTPLEVDDAINESVLVRPSPDTWDLNYLPTFLKETNPIFDNSEDLNNCKKGYPYLMVLVRSAARVIEVFKILRSLGTDVRIGQFFAKHKSVEEQVKSLETFIFHIVVGTPNRIQTLVEKGSLLLEQCQHVIVDMSKDVKSFTILDLNDTKVDFFQFYYKHLHQHVKQNKMKMVLF